MVMNTIEKWFKNSTASQTLISNFWNINTYLILLITISALGWQGFTASLVSIREGCGNDGGHYCAMAGTSPLPNFPNTPYSQRVLLPFLVKLIFQPNEIIETVHQANEIGISIVHIHARDESTLKNTYKKEVYQTIIEGVKKHCPELLICVS